MSHLTRIKAKAHTLRNMFITLLLRILKHFLKKKIEGANSRLYLRSDVYQMIF